MDTPLPPVPFLSASAGVTWSHGRWAGGEAWTAHRHGDPVGALEQDGRAWIVRVDGAPDAAIVDLHQAAVTLIAQLDERNHDLRRARERNLLDDLYCHDLDCDREEVADAE
jgi:hypothetical protein